MESAPEFYSLGGSILAEPAVLANWRNRICGYELVDPNSVIPHTSNWRIHGEGQRTAINSILADIGWADVALVNVNTRNIVNGHLRQEEAIKAGQQLPVLWIDVTEEEELTLLASIDPIATMAETNWARLADIQERIQGATSAAVAELVEDIKEQGMGAIDLPPQESSAFYYPPDERQARVERRDAESQLPPGVSAVRQVSLYYSTEDHAEYLRLIEIVKPQFETTASAAAVLDALRFCVSEADRVAKP